MSQHVQYQREVTRRAFALSSIRSRGTLSRGKMSDLTEYERERLARIAENKKLLQSLQIDRDSRASRDGTPELKPKVVKRKAAAPSRRVKTEPAEGLRVSTRSRTQRTASLATRDPEAAKRKMEEEEEEERQALLAAKELKHSYAILLHLWSLQCSTS